MSDQRPKFLRAFLDEVGKEVDERGWIAIVPYVLIGSVAIAGVITYFVPDRFWANDKWEPAVAFYAGILTFNGLVLTLGWNAFSRVYDVLMRGEFGKYLMKNGLLNSYLTHITNMHIFQILAALASGAGLVCVFIDAMPIRMERILLTSTLAFTIYAIKQAFGAVTVMNDLVWQSAFFETHRKESKDNVYPLGSERI